jgi:hypothetical protein
LFTLALEGSSASVAQTRGLVALRYADLVALVIALPVFLLVGASMAGYAAIAAAWIVQRGIQLYAERRAARSLAAGVRRNALGAIAAATLARLWLVTLSILLVGLLVDRQAGLAAAVLALVLVTLSLGGRTLSQLLSAPERDVS